MESITRIVSTQRFNAQLLPNKQYRISNISFYGNDSFEKTKKNKIGTINHQTAFFREPKTDEFVQGYIKKVFRKKSEINIVSGACSSGEEVYSYACMLNDLHKKVNIVGFDIDNKVLKEAEDGIFDIKRYKDNKKGCRLISENFLLENNDSKSKYLRRCKENFFKYFNELSSKETLPITYCNSLSKAIIDKKAHSDRLFWQELGINLDKEQIKKMITSGLLKSNETFDTQKFKVNRALLNNCNLEFRYGDIRKLKDLFKEDSKIDVLLYRNALYHTLCNKGNDVVERLPKATSERIMNSISKEMHRIVSDNGLVVFGEDEDLQGINKEEIFKCMIKNGFEPIYLNKNKEDKMNVNIWFKPQKSSIL